MDRYFGHMAVEVIIEDARWGALEFEVLAERAVTAVLGHLDLATNAWEVAILACDDARIAVLNEDFRDKPQPTNVLSWPAVELAAQDDGALPKLPVEGPELGDVALAFETCQREAAEQGKPIEQHVLHLIVHGVLHLLGYDHERNGDGDLMESAETKILQALGVPDPY